MVDDNFDDLDLELFSAIGLDDPDNFISDFKFLITIARNLELDETTGHLTSNTNINKERKLAHASIITCLKKVEGLSEPTLRTFRQEYINNGYLKGAGFDVYEELKETLKSAALFFKEPYLPTGEIKEFRRLELMLAEKFVKAGGEIKSYKAGDFGKVLELFHSYSGVKKYRIKSITDEYMRRLKKQFENEQKESAEYLKSVEFD